MSVVGRLIGMLSPVGVDLCKHNKIWWSCEDCKREAERK